MSYPLPVDVRPDETTGVTLSDDTMSRWKADLKIALPAISVKTVEIDMMWRYYEGEHPQVWLTNKLRAMFSDLADQMIENYCEPAIDGPLRRLEVTGWALAGNDVESEAAGEPGRDLSEEKPDADPGNPDPDAAEDKLDAKLADEIWADNALDLEQSELYRHEMIAGEAFLIGWEDDNGEREVHVNDPRNIYWHPCAGNPRQVEFVTKVWQDSAEGIWRTTMYYEREVVRLVGPRLKGQGIQREDGATGVVVPRAQDFRLDPDDPGGLHGFERVPVHRFARQRKRMSRLKNLRPIQDKINKLEANKMVAAEFGAFKQRAYLTTQSLTKEAIRQEPDHAIILDPGGGGDDDLAVAPTSIHEFSATDLSNYDNTKQREIEAFFVISNLPKHLMVNPGAAPSGAAITADEGPFVEMLRDMQRFYGATWKDVMGMFGLDVVPVWRNPSVEDPVATATTIKTLADAGVPATLTVRRYAGWDQDEVDELTNAQDQQKKDDAKRQADLMKGLDQGVGAGMHPNAGGLPVPMPPPAATDG